MFTTTPVLSILPAPDKWRLAVPLRWEAPDLVLTIPKGWVTDLASIPHMFQNIMDVNGRSRQPALLHDWLYNVQDHTREFADEQLRRALILYGASEASARVYWLGVRAGGWVPWNRRMQHGGGLQVSDFASPADYVAWRDSVLAAVNR